MVYRRVDRVMFAHLSSVQGFALKGSRHWPLFSVQLEHVIISQVLTKREIKAK